MDKTFQTPFVSVVVPVYNGERTLRDCLEALSIQSYPNDCLEILVVDNNSTDRSQEIALELPKVQLLSQTKIQNSYVARNMGVEHASGEIVAFTDADCIPAPDWLSQLVAPFQDPDVLAVGGIIQDAEPGNLVERFVGEQNLIGKYLSSPDQFLKPMVTANAAYRKEALISLNGFNDLLYTGADIDLAWRLQLQYGDCIRFAFRAVVQHRHRSNWISMFRQYRRHGFGEVLLDALYRNHPGYPRTLSYQRRRISRQSLAALKNLRSFLYRMLRHPFQRDNYYLLQPLLWFVSECGNVWGKMQGLWATRGLRMNPALRQWQDPGG